MRLRYLPVIEKGKHLHLPFIHHFNAKKILIESGSLILAHADGEPFSAVKLEIEILPAHYLFRV
jgi:diacylglycerol kinase family enzyme